MKNTNFTNNQTQLVANQIKTQGKKKWIIWLLWFFLGSFGAHRYYTKRYTSAIIWTVFYVGAYAWILIDVKSLLPWIITFVLFLWWVIDAFCLNGWVNEYNAVLKGQMYDNYFDKQDKN